MLFHLCQQGFSMLAIAKKYGIHRNMVKRYISRNSFHQYCKNQWQRFVFDPCYQVIDAFLAEDDYQIT